MEVYATIFMIFVSNVLSSFTQSFSPRQKDVRHIPQPKSRRAIYYNKDHYIEEDNRWNSALERIMSFINSNREGKANDDCVRNIRFGAEEMVTAKISDMNSPKKSIIDSDKNILKLPRMNEESDTGQRIVFPTALPFRNSAANTEFFSKKIEKFKTANTPSIKSVVTDPWANRAKMKFITVRPWNQFCLTCNSPVKFYDECVKKGCSSYHKKRKKKITPRFLAKSTTALNHPWMFFVDPDSIKTRNLANKCSTRAIFCENQRCNSRLRKKRNYFLLVKSHLGVLKNALIRHKKDLVKNMGISDILPFATPELISGGMKKAEKKSLTPMGKISIPLGQNSFRIRLLSKINKLQRRSPELNGNKKISDLVNLISWGRRNKNDLEKGIPSCQKSCFYNLTSLVNAQTIKPLEYFRQNPTFHLYCEEEVGCINTSQPASSGTTNKPSSTYSPLPEDLDMSDSSAGNDSGDGQFSMTGTPTDLKDSSTDKLSNSETTSGTAIISPGSTPTFMRKLLQLRNNKKKITVKHKDKFNLKLMIKNKDDSIFFNEERTESESIPKPLYYLISYKSNDTFEDNPSIVHMMKIGSVKKIQPWDKFCPCSGDQLSTISEVAGLKRQPWDSACVDCKLNKPDNDFASTRDPHQSVEVINRPPSLEDEDIFDNLHNNHSTSDRKKLFLIRIPVAGTQRRRNGIQDFIPHSNDTTNTKHVKPRSILDLFIPPLLKKSTMRPVEHVPKPWEELWKFREGKFNLFTTPKYVTDIPGKCIQNEAGTTNGPHFVSKSLLEYIAETCPSCSKNRKYSILKTTVKEYGEFGTTDDLCYEDMVSDDSASNELTNEKPDIKSLSDVLKLPEINLIEISSPPPHQAKSLKGLTILQSHGSPPKYFIEVPEQWTRLWNTAQGASSIPPVSLKKKSKPCPEKLRNAGRKKPIILCLQPFDINGNSVYLPMSNFDIFDKVEPSTPGCASDVMGDLEEQTSFPRGKTPVDVLIENSGSILPFVLVPAYLAMHPHGTTQDLFHDTDHTNFTCEDRKPLLCGDSGGAKIIDQDDETENNLPVEKKSNSGVKQLRHTTPMTVTNHIGLTKKPPRKSSRKSAPSSRPSYIIFMHGLADDPSVNQGDLSLMDDKVAVSIDPLENFVLI